MPQRVSDSLARRRLATLVLTGFGGFALFLSVVGVYGVIAYWVTQRRREIGIRVALGANRGRIIRLVGREAAIMLGAGLVVGLAAAVVLTRTMTGLLFGVGATDPLTFALASIVVAVAVAMAT